MCDEHSLLHSWVYSNTPPAPSQEGSVLLPYEGGQGDVSFAGCGFLVARVNVGYNGVGD